MTRLCSHPRLLIPLAAFAACLPLLMVSVPPLVDAPGHLARIAIGSRQMADPTIMAQYVSVRPLLLPNLGLDAPVAALAPLIGVVRAFWLVTFLIPIMMTLAIGLVARAWNREGAFGIGWALVFVWSSPFLWGFLNYWLACALALIGFSGWRMLADRPGVREPIYWIAIPIVFLAHAVAGGLMVLLIGASAFSRHLPLRTILSRTRPLLGILPFILWWRLAERSTTGHGTTWSLESKAEEFFTILRDRNAMLDIGSVIAVIAVLAIGRWKGARLVPGTAWPVAMIWLAFLALPFGTAGGAYLDMRLVPIAFIVTLILVDWRPVAPRLRQAVLLCGLALFAVRIGITTVAFIGAEKTNRRAVIALTEVEPGARIMSFAVRQCTHWAHPVRSHLPSLAAVYRNAWVNSLWDVPGLHTTEIVYRPSPLYYHDPSQRIWAEGCPLNGKPIDQIDADRTLPDVLTTLPDSGYDYLWLIGAQLTAAQLDGRFTVVWEGGDSGLYRPVAARDRTGRSHTAINSATPTPSSQPASTSVAQ